MNHRVSPVQSVSDGKFQWSLVAMETQFNFLLGKLLTIVDASFSDQEQRKAVKDLVRNVVWEQKTHIERAAFSEGEGVLPLGNGRPERPE